MNKLITFAVAVLFCAVLVLPPAGAINWTFKDNVVVQGAGGISTTNIITKNPYVDVRAYGAVGDGVADDTVAIQLAINAAKVYCEDTTGYRRGAVVFFPRGEYKVTSPLNATTALQKSENMTFRGSGDRASIITAVLSSAGPVIDFTGQSRVRLEDIGIESRSASSNATAILLFAENALNSSFSNRNSILERVILNAFSPYIVAAVVAYNSDLLAINNSSIANGSGTDAISIGPHVPITVTSPFQSFGSRTDGTEYYINNSTIIGGHAARIYGGPTLNVSNSYFARISPVGTDNAIIVFECNTTNGPSFIAHGFRSENQTSDNNISLIYAKGVTGGMNTIVIDGDTFLQDTDGDFPQGGYIRSNGNMVNVYLHVYSDFNDARMFNVAGSIFGSVYGHSNHSAIGTVTGKIYGWDFTGNVNSESTMFASLKGVLAGTKSGLSSGQLIMSNDNGTDLIRVRWKSSDNTLIYEVP